MFFVSFLVLIWYLFLLIVFFSLVILLLLKLDDCFVFFCKDLSCLVWGVKFIEFVFVFGVVDLVLVVLVLFFCKLSFFCLVFVNIEVCCWLLLILFIIIFDLYII